MSPDITISRSFGDYIVKTVTLPKLRQSCSSGTVRLNVDLQLTAMRLTDSMKLRSCVVGNVFSLLAQLVPREENDLNNDYYRLRIV